MLINFTTPALLFPAISLLILAYNNRFLAIATLIRNLHSQYEKENRQVLKQQIVTLRRRVYLIRLMQTFAILSFLFCFVCMFLLFWEKSAAATWVFAGSLLLMIGSLTCCLWEIIISAGALKVLLKNFEEKE
jgi:uncharacterized protein DUF2721